MAALNLAELATSIKNDVNEWCSIEFDDGHRNHLGASLIGHECSRYLWYVFRWCKKEKFDGRMQRLFNRGHREEPAIIKFLTGIGCRIWFEDYTSNPLLYVQETDEFFFTDKLPTNYDTEYCVVTVNKGDELWQLALAKGVKPKQFRISGANGHFGGSLDGIVSLPPKYGYDKPLLLECKTSGTGKGFNALGVDGVVRAKPQHFAQMSSYGRKYGFEHALYICVNKNDDDLYIEIVPLDYKLGEQMELKAEKIIASQVSPPRLSDNPTYFKCQYCAMKTVCHDNQPVEKNCRSCSSARPVENGEWYCNCHQNIIPSGFIKLGCDNHASITQNN